jgi:hypothetical protein
VGLAVVALDDIGLYVAAIVGFLSTVGLDTSVSITRQADIASVHMLEMSSRLSGLRISDIAQLS